MSFYLMVFVDAFDDFSKSNQISKIDIDSLNDYIMKCTMDLGIKT